MKKYKLIQWYPSLPQEWKQHKEVIVEQDVTLRYRFRQYYNCTSEIENNPEFWEEIKPYIILKLSSRKENSSYPEGTVIKNQFKEESWQKYWNIYSIQRLSDNVVFSVGDNVYETITGKKDSWVIKEFSLKDGRCFSCGINIESFEHKKEPLFITEDGVGKFKNEYYYYVVENDKATIPSAWEVLGHYIDWDSPAIIPLGAKQFNSKSAAESYIRQNKPQYSEKQVVNILRGFDKDVASFGDVVDFIKIPDENYLEYINKYK